MSEKEYIKLAKSEAIKDFAERVKMAFYYEFEELIPSIMADKIDEIVKEMTEGKMAEKYIEREALIEDFKNDFINLLFDGMKGTPKPKEIKISNVIERIEDFPAADVAPVRHAKWELIDECVNEGVYCSNCHKKIYRAEYANQKVKSNFCPNCGAKMDQEVSNDKTRN